MKYAFIIGSNAFVVPGKVINYISEGGEKEFLRINSIYHDQSPPAPETFLDCDIYIKDTDGTPLTLINNKPAMAAPYNIETSRDSIHVIKADGATLIHVHQLDEKSAMSLEHNITAELEVNMPVAVIRITGEFLLGDLHIIAENEKLYVNNKGYGNSVNAGANQLKFAEEGVVL